jgi:hypothetical protein
MTESLDRPGFLQALAAISAAPPASLANAPRAAPDRCLWLPARTPPTPLGRQHSATSVLGSSESAPLAAPRARIMPPRRRALRIAAATLPAALLAAGSALVPPAVEEPVHGSRARAAAKLATVAADRATIHTGYLLVVLGLLALAPLLVTIARQGAGLARTGAALAAAGAALGAVVNASGFALTRAADPALDATSMAAYLATPSGTLPLILLYVTLLPLGLIILGLGLWHSSALPRAAALLFVLSALIAVSAPSGALGAVLTLPLLMASATVAATSSRSDLTSV